MTAPADSSAADPVWADLMAGNERFRLGRPQARDLVLERQAVSQGQRPKAIVLTCSDSRVSPEIIFDQRLGDLFVIRTAGNLADKLALGSIEFAVENLGVRLVLVLGHQNCGAVRAAYSGAGPLSSNVTAIVAAIRLSGGSVESGADCLLAAVKRNIIRVAESVLEGSDVLRRRQQDGGLWLRRALYHLDSGAVEGL